AKRPTSLWTAFSSHPSSARRLKPRRACGDGRPRPSSHIKHVGTGALARPAEQSSAGVAPASCRQFPSPKEIVIPRSVATRNLLFQRYRRPPARKKQAHSFRRGLPKLKIINRSAG